MKKLEGEEEIIEAFKVGTLGATAAAKVLGIARSSFYRRVKWYEDKEEIDL
jgi:transcriptional regulator of acetoin/glycerol metabolism